eukprot:1818013-Amphidinium_carterae.1
MTVRFDELVYGTDSWRHKSETLLQYTLRKQQMVKNLSAAGCTLPPSATGLLILKGANLNKVENESVMFWLSGSYEAPQVIEALRKLDRPMHAGSTNAPHAFWGEEEEGEPEWSEWPEAWWTPEEEIAYEEPAQEIEQADADNVLTEAEAQD